MIVLEKFNSFTSKKFLKKIFKNLSKLAGLEKIAYHFWKELKERKTILNKKILAMKIKYENSILSSNLAFVTVHK